MNDQVLQQVRQGVIKFLPSCCPNVSCRQPFQENGRGGYQLLNFWRQLDSEAAQQFSAAFTHTNLRTDIVVCATCGNATVRVILEERYYLDPQQAAAAIRREGFVALGEVKLSGNACVPDPCIVAYRLGPVCSQWHIQASGSVPEEGTG